ncbi:MAG: hypothetical protein VYE44_09535 [Verrucomicrobiota bacterium]|nr:hypothetical protein [Verrucomicrobiota bacterium]
MRIISCAVILAATLGFGQAALAKSTSVKSPNGQFTIELTTGDSGRPSFSNMR